MDSLAPTRPGPFDSGPIARQGGDAPAARDPRFDNAPPLEERILMDFVEDIQREGIEERINELIEGAGRTPAECDSELIAGKMGDLCKQARAIGKKLDDARERHNRQLIDARTALKAKADNMIAPLTTAIDGVRALLDDWTARETVKREEEHRAATRIDYAKRVILHIIDCGNGFIDSKSYPFPILIRELEEKIQANENDFGPMAPDVEKARIDNLAKLKAAFERHLASAPPVETPAEQAEAPEPPAPATPTFEAPKMAPAPVARGAYGSAVGATTVWNFEIENMRQVPDRYLKHPKVKEALESVIRAAIRTERVRDMKGVRIWSGTKAAVR